MRRRARGSWITVLLRVPVVLALIVPAMLSSDPIQAVPPRSEGGLPAVEASADLVITDVWRNQTQIHYQIRNVGEGTSPAGPATQLEIDGKAVVADVIEAELAPGERLARLFDYPWLCTDPDDSIVVCADAGGVVDETDEKNNCRTEVWKCDARAPGIISGPTVSDLYTDAVRIKWETDEAGDSCVDFDTDAGTFGTTWCDPVSDIYHEAVIEKLTPSTVYQYRVRSTDACSNSVVSKAGFFETLPEKDVVTPTLSSLVSQRLPGSPIRYRFGVSAEDNVGIERVELYLDKEHIATDYTPAKGDGDPVYEFDVVPGALGMDFDTFFQAHEVTAVAVNLAGTRQDLSEPFAPPRDPMDGELAFLAPAADYVHYIEGTAVPPGSELAISVRAVAYAADLCPTIGFGDMECTHLTRPVDHVTFYVDANHLCTVGSQPDGRYDCAWGLGGLGPGTHEIVVQAYDAEGRYLFARRTVEIRTGAASLEVERTVTRDAGGFLVRLEVENVGTLPAQVDCVEDALTGFQAVNKRTDHYWALVSYDDCTMQSAVSIDVYDDTGHALTLHPGDTLTIEYRAVPILYQGMPEVHAIGATPVTVNYLAEGTGHLGTFARPCVLVGDETLSDAVTAHRAASDYLIITNPRALFADNPRRSDVDVLLSAVADLASLKSGILGYLTYSASWSGVDATIDAWGRGMRSSDGTPGDYLHDGYLLIVGEIEIVAAATLTAGALYNIPLSDALYADTYDNMTDPELMVGRIIGNNALELLIPVNTILSLHRGTAGYGFDRSHAFVMSGFDMGRSGESDDIDMDQERWDVTWYLEADGTTVTQLDTADYAISRTLSVAAIIASLPDQDIVHIAGHGSPWHIDDLAEWDLTPHLDPFGSASPFVYGSACLSGRYALSYDRPIVTGLAERFLRCGAAAYLGSTQVSYDPANRNIAGSIYAHWDSGRSIGSVVKEVKISRGTGAWWWQEDYWAMAYQLFGDPQLGLDVYIAPSAMPALQPQPAGVPPTITVAIPDYQIDQYEDGDIQVRIPDGFWLQVPGQPMVPTYDSTLPIPAGERVQDVVLASRSGLSTTTGLEIPSYDPKVAGPAALADVAPPDDVAWWPDRDFEWHVSDNADGSSELLIRITPFFYNPLTTDVRFYRDYAFAIETAPSTVQIVRLETDQDAYAPNTPVAIALASHNSAAEEDITVSAMIKALGSGEVAGGLPLRSLKALSGLGTLSLAWNTAAHPAGDYVLEVEIRDATGELLDRALTNFRVGILSIATANWTVLPAIFRPGDDITLSFDAQNTGTHAITATAVIEVLSPTSGTVALFSQEIVDLAPGGGVPVTASWDTPAAPETFYAVTAYVQYDSTTTPLLTATLRPWQRCFLPVVTR